MSSAQELKKKINNAEKMAVPYSLECEKIIEQHGLELGLKYCKEKGIEPPQCSLTAKSENADRLRAKALSLLGQSKWWKRRLATKAAQDFEMEQIKSGNVTSGISDASLAYNRANR